MFSRPAHLLFGQSYVGKVLVLNARQGWGRHGLDAARDGGAADGTLALLLNTANPIMAQGAAFADLSFMDRFPEDITAAIAHRDEVIVDPQPARRAYGDVRV